MAFSLRNAAASLRKSTTISTLPNRRSFLKAHHNFGLAFSPTLYSSRLSQFNPKGPRFSISASYGTGGQNVLDTAQKEKKLQIKERSMAFSLRNAAASLRKSTTISTLPNRRSFLKAHHNFGLAFSPTLYSSRLSQFNPKVGPRFSISASYGTGGQNVLDTAAPPKIENDEEPSRNWKIKMLYDGECPLCMKEVNMLKERDKTYGAIKFVDISSEEYSPEQNQGLDYKTVMGRIHAILSDGTVVKDVEAFRKLYEAVGLGWVYAITKYEPIATIADAVYGVWAKYRLQITGRPPLEEVVQARKNKELCNDSKTCKT